MTRPAGPASGTEYFVGVDLAWGQRGTTGLAVLDDAGSLLDVTTRLTDEDILLWLRPWTAGSCFVAFDAPIVVVNPSGHRPCERLVSHHFGRYGASCHAANTANPSFANGSRALRLADALALDLAPTALRRAAEVYPHPALVTLFDLPKILTYKHKPGRDFPHLQSELLRLITLLESLADASPPLLLNANHDWQAIRCAAQTAIRKSQLKRLEDAIDSVVCAYIALYATTHPSRTRLLGNPTTGQILVPVTPTHAHQIDHPWPQPDGAAADGQHAPPGRAHDREQLTIGRRAGEPDHPAPGNRADLEPAAAAEGKRRQPAHRTTSGRTRATHSPDGEEWS